MHLGALERRVVDEHERAHVEAEVAGELAQILRLRAPVRRDGDDVLVEAERHLGGACFEDGAHVGLLVARHQAHEQPAPLQFDKEALRGDVRRAERHAGRAELADRAAPQRVVTVEADHLARRRERARQLAHRLASKRRERRRRKRRARRALEKGAVVPPRVPAAHRAQPPLAHHADAVAAGERFAQPRRHAIVVAVAVGSAVRRQQHRRRSASQAVRRAQIASEPSSASSPPTSRSRTSSTLRPRCSFHAESGSRGAVPKLSHSVRTARPVRRSPRRAVRRGRTGRRWRR